MHDQRHGRVHCHSRGERPHERQQQRASRRSEELAARALHLTRELAERSSLRDRPRLRERRGTVPALEVN
jgi:hypothetical protein